RPGTVAGKEPSRASRHAVIAGPTAGPPAGARDVPRRSLHVKRAFPEPAPRRRAAHSGSVSRGMGVARDSNGDACWALLARRAGRDRGNACAADCPVGQLDAGLHPAGRRESRATHRSTPTEGSQMPEGTRMKRLARVTLLSAGALVGGVVGAAVLGARAWDRAASRMVGRVVAAERGAHPRTFRAEMLAGLPAPVTRYFEFALTPGQPLVRTARVEHAGEFRT